MIPTRLLTIAAVGLLLTVLTACGISLAGDVTPPASFNVPTVVPQTTAQIVFPVVPPDPAKGAPLYAEKCTSCHGPGGLGNGSQAAQMPIPVPALGSAAVARAAAPITWFTTITQGHMERMMPPYRDLTDRQRWDLVAYLYTLSTSAEDLEAGKSVYEGNCQACHGAKGIGDGVMAASLSTRVPDWSDQTRLSKLSAQQLVETINKGSGQVMPAFETRLSADQRWAVASYIRSLTFASPVQQSAATTVPAAAATAQPTQPPTGAAPQVTPAAALKTVTFAGKVTHANGKPLPDGLQVVLQGFDNMTPGLTLTADVRADGSYDFKDIELVQGRVFVATLTYQNIEFSSDTLRSDDLGSAPVVDLPITVTDASTDASVLVAQRVHIFLDFTLEGRVQIAQLFLVLNPTDSAIVPADSQAPGLVFDLPAGAANLQFQDGELGGRFVLTPTGFGDLQEVLPNTMHQVLYGFDLPYENNRASITLPFSLPVDSLVLMVPAEGVTVESPALVSSGVREVENTTIRLYSGASFARGSSLQMTISGKPAAPASPVVTTSSTNSLLIGLGVFAVALILVGLWLFRQKKNQAVEILDEEEEEPEESEDALLDAIVALDDLYQAGKLPEAAYRERRAELKARLKAIMEA